NFSAESTFVDGCSDAIIVKKSLSIQMKDMSLHNVDNSGIYIYKGAIISIHGFLLSESIKGMNIESSFFVSIKNSQVYHTYVGIHLVESRYVNITNNVLEKNDYGLIIESSSRIIIAKNRILSNKKNIVIKSSHDVKIIDNDFGDYGIGIYLIYVVNLCVIVFWAIYLIDIKKKRIGR
ncbi:MAG: NosD domain-containing protein, partial [Candidatus Njordarchaeota archaeon]